MATATVTAARRAAHAVVRRTLADGAFADRALHGEARGLDPRERGLAKQLAFGAVQRRLTLDHVISQHVDRRLEPGIRAALHLGLFQLLFLDGVAPYAAIGESVELAKPSPGHKLADAKAFDGDRGFDRVLLDPPCSGLGTLQSHPDLRWRITPDDIERLAAEQDELLAAARRALRPGGTLVYSVCTLSPREERLVTADVRRTLPPVDHTDGFYIARDGG